MFKHTSSLILALGLVSTATCQDPISFLDYDPVTGNLSIAGTDDSVAFTTLEIESPAGVFNRTTPPKNSIFDVYYDNKFFTLANSGLVSGTDLGPIVAEGLDPSVLAADICVNGSLLGGGTLRPAAVRANGDVWPVLEKRCSIPPRPLQIEPIDFFLDYSPSSGNLSIESLGQPLSLVRLQAAGGTHVFGDVRPEYLTEPTDSYSLTQLTLTSVNGFETFDLGPILTSRKGFESPSAAELASTICYRATTTEVRPAGQLFLRSEGGQAYSVDACGNRIALPVEAFEFLLDPAVDVGIVIDSEDNLIVHVPLEVDAAVAPLIELNITASENIFNPHAANPTAYAGPFDLLNRNSIFLSNSNGLPTTINLGPILHPSVDPNGLDDLLTIEGKFLGGGVVEKTDIVVVPEPSASLMGAIGLMTIACLRRRR